MSPVSRKIGARAGFVLACVFTGMGATPADESEPQPPRETTALMKALSAALQGLQGGDATAGDGATDAGGAAGAAGMSGGSGSSDRGASPRVNGHILTGEAISASQPAGDGKAESGGATAGGVDEPEPDIHVSPQGRVEMHVRDLNLSSVLQMLSMQSQRNIVASKDVGGKVTANLYNVTFEEALTAILDANNAGWREQGNFIYVYTHAEIAELEAAARQRVTKVFTLKYVPATAAISLLNPLLSKDGKVSAYAATPGATSGSSSSSSSSSGSSGGSGGSSTGLTSGSAHLLVVDYAPNVQAMGELLDKVDSRPKQVLVEATILRAQLNENNNMGIDFNLVGGVDFQNLSSTSNAITNLTVGALPQRELQNTSFTTRTDFTDAVPAGGFTFGIIKNNIATFVRALEAVTDTTVIANPKVLGVNMQPGEVIVGRRDGYLTTTVTETSAVQNVQFLETGTQLQFTPYIGDDGYVMMTIHPKDSTGGLTAANLPFEQTTEVTTNIMVRDGHTILIGGLFREVTSAGREQLPIAGNLPIAGALFRSSNDSTQREEVIILLTVKVVPEPDMLAESGEQLAQDIERFRVGMRQGLQWWGRERLAQAHYHWAIQHLEKGKLSSALWDLDLAINNNPKFLAAIKLKEQLMNRREYDDDASATRHFVEQQVSRESGHPEPVLGRPGPPFPFLPLEGPSGFDESSPAPAGKPESNTDEASRPGQGAS